MRFLGLRPKDYKTLSKKFEIDNYFEVSSVGLPKGMINRKDEEPKSKDDWGNVVSEIINNSPLFDIDISASPFVFGDYDIEIHVKALENVEGEYNIVIALTEDSIVDWQKNGTLDDSVYVHNHVLRAIINNTWGENLKSSFVEWLILNCSKLEIEIL